MRLPQIKMPGLPRPALPPFMARVARAGGVRIHGLATDEAGAMPARADDLRGSGSWANEWVPLARAAGLSPPTESPMDGDPRHPVRPRAAVPAPAPAPAPVAPLTSRALMDAPLLRLHGFLQDRIEEEAPLCGVHAKVSLSAFVIPSEGRAPEIADLSVDLLIVDGDGTPRMALLRRNTRSAQAEATIENALEEVGVPVHWLRARVAPHKLWSHMRAHLPDA
ncbi:hypothetical protein JQC91_00450 [Jannaschia sp. Os4]|uniref:hypothetical protein n=1 Tax=Jannaschia sp. Os4 TaxID=2807617 RepID=UPI001939F88A|nr:hypothetical protein [Jannaschia sp. Os4]MBM2574760.1 hypothetical protein [Jannaschia sp. Os4]